MERTSCAAALISLVVFSSSSIAGVDFSLSSPSAGLVTIGCNATAGEAIRGIAITVSLSDNATAVYSDIVSIHPAFNVFIDYASENPIYTIGDGHPFARPDNAGLLEVPASVFSLSMGHLDEGGNPAPATIDNLITFRIQDGGAGFSYVTISQDPLRGGVVGDNVNTVTMPQPLMVITPEPATLALLAAGGVMLRKKAKGKR